MFAFLTPARREQAGPLANVAQTDHFWRSLPRNDPLAAQKSICEALADVALEKELNRDQLRATLALDQRARALGGALLVNYGARSANAKPFERRYWRAAMELSRAFASTLEYFLRYMRNEPAARNWREYAPAVVLRMFRHRQVEFLLRPFLNDAPIPETWAELHATYQFVESQGWAHHPIPDKGERETDAPSTLQKEYLHILLLDLMNGGQFSPYDAFWLSRWIPHWTPVVSLRADLAEGSPEAGHFVVDLDSAEGLKRVSPGPLGHSLYVDATPLLALIESEIESLRDPLNPVRIPSSFGSARQLKLLRKVAASYSPRPPRINRRGERKPVSSAVKAVIGLGHIMKMLRHEEKRRLAATAVAIPEVEEITITVDGGYTQSSIESVDTEGARTSPSGYEFGVQHHLWQVKDRSASGCRLRAPSADASRVLPGTLVAIRDDESMRWSLVVVRRLKGRIGDRVDIGVQYVGQNPRGVTMAFEASELDGTHDANKETTGIFTALYLRESMKQPIMPFKTLIMSTAMSTGTRCLTLRSASAEYTVRLKEPIEEQDEFVWLPYEVLDRRNAEAPAPAAASEGATPLTFPSKIELPGDTSTDWLIPHVRNRAENAA
jgi:hypothetical protein